MMTRLLSQLSTGALAFLCGGMLFVHTAFSADIVLGNMMPGSGVIHKKIVSMREQRYVNLVPQRTDFSCGAAALATILKYAYGRDEVTEQSVLLDLFKISDPELVRQKGFSLLDIKRYVQSIGMRGRGYQMNIDQLKKIKVPTIVLINLKGYKHFVVVKRTDENSVYIADPTLGNKVYDFKDFKGIWNGIIFAVIGPGFDKNNILMNPPPPLTARNLNPVYRMLTNAELLDFGFSHADLFNF